MSQIGGRASASPWRALRKGALPSLSLTGLPPSNFPISFLSLYVNVSYYPWIADILNSPPDVHSSPARMGLSLKNVVSEAQHLGGASQLGMVNKALSRMPSRHIVRIAGCQPLQGRVCKFQLSKIFRRSQIAASRRAKLWMSFELALGTQALLHATSRRGLFRDDFSTYAEGAPEVFPSAYGLGFLR
jgi:hypothetical protein